jgi:hypothetical protein
VRRKNDDEIKNLRVYNANDRLGLQWDAPKKRGGDAVLHYVLYYFEGEKIGDTENPQNILALVPGNAVDLRPLVQDLEGTYTFAVTTVNRWKQESKAKGSVQIKF